MLIEKKYMILAFLKKNKELITSVLLLFMVSCNKPTFEIKGQLPDSKYDGEWVFLVPMEKHTVKDVDSVLIKNNSFVFKGNIERVAVIRMRMALRLRFQELLVVTEPGQINVQLDSISSAMGTPQNNALQKWKDYRQETSSKLMLERKERNIKPYETFCDDKIKRESYEFNYKLLKEMGNNTLGNFLYNTVRIKVSEANKSEIDSIFKTPEE